MTIYQQTRGVIEELATKANLKPGSMIVVGCSTSEVLGAKIGTNSNPDTAKEIFDALHDYVKENGLHLAVQCCEHLNRAIITERSALPFVYIMSEQCYSVIDARKKLKAFIVTSVVYTNYVRKAYVF